MDSSTPSRKAQAESDGGVLSAVLIAQHGFPFAMGVAGAMAIAAGLLIVPLKYNPPVWREPAQGMPSLQPGG